jgi:lipopolysaccharide assembly outer membrane protein LptD (OstA)
MKSAWMFVTVLALVASVGWAAPNPLGPMDGLSGIATSTVPVDIQARSMEYNRARNLVVASGNVVVTREGEELKADSIQLNTVTHDVEARGNVVFTRLKNVWRGNYMRYNFATGAWNTGAFESTFDPFFVTATSAKMTTNETEYVLKRAVLTTCTNHYKGCHYTISSRTLRVKPGNRMIGRHTVMRLGGIPVFYTPIWYRALSDRAVGLSAETGYRKRMGYFLLISIKYWMSQSIRGVTQIDYRGKRGPALGQEIGWHLPEQAGHGRIYGYFANDDGVADDESYGDSDLIDTQRYRLRFQHYQTFTPRDYFLADANYLSDPFIMEDFFNKEHRAGYQPQNFATVTHRGDAMTFGVSAYKRLNDFYTAVDRLPEVFLDVNRQQLGDSPLYYENRNSAAFLQMVHDVNGEGDDYSASRLDSSHMLYWPTRHFGFLNLMPRAGGRGTYYSETVTHTTVTQVVNVVTTNMVTNAGGVTTPVVTSRTQTNTTGQTLPLGSDVRMSMELGLETSFRAFKVINNDENIFGTGLRHVVEPYANYTFIPEPNLTPDDLYQFDSVDTLDKTSTISLGVRNKMQTKRKLSVDDIMASVDDIMDLDVFTTYNLDDETDQPFSNVGMNSEFHLASWWLVYMDASYNTYNSQLDTFNARTRFRGEVWKADIEYRSRIDESNLLYADLAYAPNKRWEFGIYDRYEFEMSRLEEQGVFVTRTLDCLAFKLGGGYLPGYTRDDGTEREDDFRMSFEIWLTAFPGVRMGSAPRD